MFALNSSVLNSPKHIILTTPTQSESQLAGVIRSVQHDHHQRNGTFLQMRLMKTAPWRTRAASRRSTFDRCGTEILVSNPAQQISRLNSICQRNSGTRLQNPYQFLHNRARRKEETWTRRESFSVQAGTCVRLHQRSVWLILLKQGSKHVLSRVSPGLQVQIRPMNLVFRNTYFRESTVP